MLNIFIIIIIIVLKKIAKKQIQMVYQREYPLVIQELFIYKIKMNFTEIGDIPLTIKR